MIHISIMNDTAFPPEDMRGGETWGRGEGERDREGEGTEKEKAIRQTSKGEEGERERRRPTREILKKESTRGREPGERGAWGGEEGTWTWSPEK